MAVASFITETAFSYVFDIAGAVIAFSIILMFTISFRNKLLDFRSFSSGK